MNEKPPLEDRGGDTFVQPTAPPSYDEATGMNQGPSSYNQPSNVYQGYPGNMPAPQPVPPAGMYPPQPMNVAYPQVPQPMPQGLPYPSQPGNLPYPAVPQPPPAGYQAVPAPPHPATTTTNVVIPAPVRFVPVGPKGQRMTCVHCGAQIKSTTVSSYKPIAHLACFALCLFFCCFCSWIPYCMNSCKKVDHSCPNCKGHLGSYND